jgi:hypothetical protein
MTIERLPRVSLPSLTLPMSRAVVLLLVGSWLPLFVLLVMVQLVGLFLVVPAFGMGFQRGVVLLSWSRRELVS